MIEFSVGATKIKISFLFLAFCAVFSLCDKSRVFTMALIASLLHEMAHIIMLYFVGECADSIILAPQGAKLVRSGKMISYKSEILVLLAGCILNFTLFAILYSFSESLSLKLFAVVNLSLGIFNMLPLGTLDGGRILKILLKNILSSQRAELVCKIVSIIVVLAFVVVGVWLITNGRKNVSLLYTSIYLIAMLIFRNYD